MNIEHLELDLPGVLLFCAPMRYSNGRDERCIGAQIENVLCVGLGGIAPYSVCNTVRREARWPLCICENIALSNLLRNNWKIFLDNYSKWCIIDLYLT